MVQKTAVATGAGSGAGACPLTKPKSGAGRQPERSRSGLASPGSRCCASASPSSSPDHVAREGNAETGELTYAQRFPRRLAAARRPRASAPASTCPAGSRLQPRADYARVMRLCESWNAESARRVKAGQVIAEIEAPESTSSCCRRRPTCSATVQRAAVRKAH